MDHILPRNHGGSGDLSNLQAHCCRCKAGKHEAVGQAKGAGLIAVGCRPATGCAGRMGVLGTGDQRLGEAGGRVVPPPLKVDKMDVRL